MAQCAAGSDSSSSAVPYRLQLHRQLTGEHRGGFSDWTSRAGRRSSRARARASARHCAGTGRRGRRRDRAPTSTRRRRAHRAARCAAYECRAERHRRRRLSTGVPSTTSSRRHGQRLDLIVRHAGITCGWDTELLTLDQWTAIIDVKHPRRRARRGRRLLADGPPRPGHIISTRPWRSRRGRPITSYVMTKHAVVGLSLALRSEAAGRGSDRAHRAARPPSRRRSWARARSAGVGRDFYRMGQRSASSTPRTAWRTHAVGHRRKAPAGRTGERAWHLNAVRTWTAAPMSIRVICSNVARQLRDVFGQRVDRGRLRRPVREGKAQPDSTGTAPAIISGPDLRPHQVVLGRRPRKLKHATLIGDVHRRRVGGHRRHRRQQVAARTVGVHPVEVDVGHRMLGVGAAHHDVVAGTPGQRHRGVPEPEAQPPRIGQRVLAALASARRWRG